VRILRRVLLALVVLAGLLLLLGAWLTGTNSGLRVGMQELERLLAPALTVESVQGRIAGRSEWRGVRYETADFMFSADRLELVWHPARLSEGLLDIGYLGASGVAFVQYRVAAADAGAAPVQLPVHISLPLDIRLQAAVIERLSVTNPPPAEAVVVDRIALAATFHDRELELRQLEVQQSQLQLQGQVTLAAHDAYPVQGALQWRLSPDGYAPVAATTRLDGTLHELQLRQDVQAPYALHAELQLQPLLAALQLEGTVELQDTALREINPGWPDMRLRGNLQAAGTPGDMQLDGALDLQDALAGALQLVFAGQWQPDALQVAKLQLSAPGQPTRLDGQGRIGFGAQPSYDFTAQWQALAWPLHGDPDYQSRQGRLALQGTASDYRLELHGDLQAADWLSGDLQLRARSMPAAGNWQIEQAELTGGASRLQLHGQAGEQFALDWTINSDNLAELIPGAGGQLAGQGRVQGAPATLAVQADLRGSGLRWREQRVGQLRVQGEVDLAGKRRSQMSMAVADARLPGMNVTALELAVSGRPRSHTLELNTRTTRGELDWQAQGDWDGSRWAFDLRRATLAWSGLAPWQLDGAMTGTLSATALQLADSCWRSGQARACLQLDAGVQAASGEFTLQDLPAAYFAAVLPPDLVFDTELAAQGSFAATRGRLDRARVTLDATPGALRMNGHGEAAASGLAFAAAQARLDVQNNQAKLDVDLPLSSAPGELQAHVALLEAHDGDWLHGNLDGQVTLDWPDIALAAQWLPEVSMLTGKVDGRLQLSGTPAMPQLQGRLQLADARATLDRPGLELEDIALSAEGTSQGTVLVNARVRSGGGELQGSGEYRLEQGSGMFHVQGEQFQVAGLPEVTAFISPDLSVALAPEAIGIRGSVAIPRAQIRPRQPPASAVSVSADQIIITPEQETAEQAGLPLDVDVTISVGNAVSLEGFGLSGGLKGNLRIVDLPQQPATATGELAISNGLYKAYGQELTITTGRLLYTGGSLDEPGLDIEAVRKPAPDITVGVKVRGKLREPRVSVFSQPSMQQSEQLSWLVLGRPLQGGSDSERSALASAALSMGLGRGESFGQQLGSALGLDEVSVNNEPGTDVSQSSLLIGKYLTPELFVSYGVGLFEPLATLKLRYALSSRWKLVGETKATGSAADLVYELERR